MAQRSMGPEKGACSADSDLGGRGRFGLGGGGDPGEGIQGCIRRKGTSETAPGAVRQRLEEVAEAVGGGYCRLQMPLKLPLAVRETAAGHRLGALEGGVPPPVPLHPSGHGHSNTSQGKPLCGVTVFSSIGCSAPSWTQHGWACQCTNRLDAASHPAQNVARPNTEGGFYLQ